MIMAYPITNTTLPFVKRRTVILLFCLPVAVFRVNAEEYFNPHLLETTETNATAVDLSWISSDSVTPGDYTLDIYVNGHYIDTGKLTFKKVHDNQDSTVQPCFDRQHLVDWGIKVEDYPTLFVAGSDCALLSAIPGSEANVALEHQHINLTFPQVALLNRPQGYVPEKQWQDGITAALLNYNISGQSSSSRNGEGNSDSQFISLQPGLNLGRWRLRNYSNLNHDDSGNQWESVYSYIARDVTFLKSQLMIGQTYTTSGVFDSVSFTGVQLNSDDEMQPDSMQGFAPTIRGVARSTADVTVYQNGNNIYKTTVPPGAFEITDLYPTGSAGDLTVVVKESDGSQQSFVVPYASLAVLRREGRFDYAFSSGKTKSASNVSTKDYRFIQSSAAWGATNNITLYGGFQQAEDSYTNLLLGSGFNLGEIGALSFDISQAWADIEERTNDVSKKNTSSGQSLRLRYSKNVVQTGTNFSVAGYRYSTSGYYSFQDFINSSVTDSSSYYLSGRPRNRFDVSISQFFEQLGSISLSLISTSYWDSSSMDSLSAGYSNTWGNISYFLNYSYNRNAPSDDNAKPTSDSVISLTVSIPFGSDISAQYSLNDSRSGNATHSIGLNGTAFEDRSLSWSAQEGYDTQDKSTSGNLNMGYQGSQGEITAGYGYDNYSTHYNYGLRGGMLLHAGGLTLGRTLSDQAVLVETSGVKGIAVRGQTNVTTDASGYAIVPYARSYHQNSVALDETQQQSNAEVDNVAKTVVPTRGAIVKVSYAAVVGYRAMLTLHYRGKYVPFGAVVSNRSMENDDRVGDPQTSIVGDDGQVYLAGLAEKGAIAVRWGKEIYQQCHATYDFSNQALADDIIVAKAECQ